MKSSTLTKTAKKELSRELEQALVTLENACIDIIDNEFACEREDVEKLVWQRKLKNIALPVSLALREYKGPRHFHQHYKHSAEDYSILQPVLDDPLETLSQTCKSALAECQSSFNGLQDVAIKQNQSILQKALKQFIGVYC